VPDPDLAVFGSDFQDANKILYVYFAYFLLYTVLIHLHQFTKITCHWEVTKQWKGWFILIFLLVDWRIRIREAENIRIRNTAFFILTCLDCAKNTKSSWHCPNIPEFQGSFIIRQLCVFLKPEAIYKGQVTCRYIIYIISIADPVSGSGASLTPWIRIRDKFSRIPNLGSRIPNKYLNPDSGFQDAKEKKFYFKVFRNFVTSSLVLFSLFHFTNTDFLDAVLIRVLSVGRHSSAWLSCCCWRRTWGSPPSFFNHIFRGQGYQYCFLAAVLICLEWPLSVDCPSLVHGWADVAGGEPEVLHPHGGHPLYHEGGEEWLGMTYICWLSLPSAWLSCCC